MSWASELPPELLVRPTGLVILTGLDTTYNAVHKAIWDSFCNNRRPDRVPLQFTVRPLDFEYPKCRSKRSSYEWYIPKGILKSCWLKKHLEQIPGVLVIFFDLDWDEVMWKEKQMECVTKVQIIRDGLVGRNTRVCVVLIQKNAPLPPGEDVIAAERAASICAACELSAKSLFVLPLTDHLLGYTIRLENAFYELAQGYYHTESRRVKAHKEFLNKTTHQLLFVRHQFKIAFFNEMKQDSHTALKHYKQAYGHVLDLRMHDTNLLEVKTIAGFINYKVRLMAMQGPYYQICRISFQHNAPLDAISQFRKHIDFFKNKTGIEDLAFEHSAWMAKQFQIFGDLFDEAIKLGLTAIQTQHPGFYYQQAANHCITRKNTAAKKCSADIQYPSPDPLENLDHLDYYGQRPWRQGHQSIDPPDLIKERDGILALQSLEVKVDQSGRIIPLLSSAVAQFKKYKSPRMKRFLMVQMGEEYYHAKDYNKSITLLSRVLWDYRHERWWPLLTSILGTALRCAYLTANVEQYVTIALELAGKYIEKSHEEKTRIQNNLMKIMMNQTPEPEPGCNSQCVEKAQKLWSSLIQAQEQSIFTVEMHNIFPFVEVKACFIEESFTADSPITVKVFLLTSCPHPIKFAKLSVLLNNQAYSDHCVVKDQSMDDVNSDLYLSPNEVKVHTFSFHPQPEDVNKTLEITSVVLQLGSEAYRNAILHWSGGGGDSLTPSITQMPYYRSRKCVITDNTPWKMVFPRASTRIEPRKPNLEILLNHEPPCLVNEFYAVKITATNKESVKINNVQLTVGLKEGQDHLNLSNKFDPGKLASLATAHMSLDQPEYDGKVVSRKSGIDVGSLAPGETINRTLYIKCLELGDRVVFARVSYDIEVSVGEAPIHCACHQDQSVLLPTVNPFSVNISLLSMQMEKLVNVHGDEPFLLVADTSCTSPWPIHILTSSFQLSDAIKEEGEPTLSQISGVSLKCGEQASECRCLIAPPAINPSICIGMYNITWRRQSSDASLPAVTTISRLPSVTVEHLPLYVDADIPANGQVRKLLPVDYHIYNRTPYSQEIEVTLEPNDVFLFSGQKQLRIRILPEGKHKLCYNLMPLSAGNVSLPRLRVNMTRYPGTMEGLVTKMLPSNIFVKPSSKDEPKIM